MRTTQSAIAVAISLTLLVPVGVVGQEAPAVTVVPDSRFCDLVADDLAACEAEEASSLANDADLLLDERTAAKLGSTRYVPHTREDL